MRALWIMGALATALAISSCGGDGSAGFVDSPVVTVAINSMNESDIDPPGIIEKDENISNQTGNPWGEFIKDVEAECRGFAFCL